MKKLLAWLMAATLTFQLVTPVFAEEIEETQTATEAVEVETETPVTEIPTTEPTTTDAMETAAPEETSAPTEPQPTTEVTEATETTASTEETTTASTEPTEETTEPTLDLFAEDENVIASGTCGADGDNLTWELTVDGTLTISGSGEMMNYSDSSVAPWYTKRTKMLSVVVEDGVTSIGDYAFYACWNLTSVTIPEGVTSIGGFAFSGCSSLTSVAIPKGVKRIAGGTFYDCTKLESVSLPEGLLSIENADSVASVPYVWHGAFKNCTSLKNIEIPDSVTSIGWDAFSGCSSLMSVMIPDSVSSIGAWAFSGCSSLTSVMIPESVKNIGNGAFSSCSSLSNITVADENTNYASVRGVLFNKRRTNLIVCPAGHGAVYQIPEGVMSIDDSAFYGCSGLTSVTIPDSVKNIGNGAFSNCSSLTSVTIPEGVTYIGSSVFFGCRSLTSVTIPKSVTYIGYAAFQHCRSLTSVTIPESVTSINSIVFYGCSGLTSVTIPEGVTSIDSGAFYGCSSLTSVTIPAGVTSISYETFYGCSSLTNVTIPEGVTSIDDRAFYNCKSLTIVTIPAGVTSIGERAFYGCDAITDVYYSGTEEEWQAIEIGNYNDALSNATIHYNYIHIHNLEHILEKAATCTEAGSKEYWHCLDCDKYFADADCTQVIREADTVLPALGHTMALTEEKAATCTEDGSNAYYTCSSCHTVFKDVQGEQETTIQAEIVPALGHDMTKVDAVKPTYSSAGHNEYYICSRCGKVFKDAQGEIETTVEAETLKGIEIRPVDTAALISGSKLTLTAWTLPGEKKARVKWSLASGDGVYASISSSGVLKAKTVSEVQNITVIATPTDGSPEARKEIQILPKITVKQVEKFNLFHSYSRAELAITGGTVDCALLDGNKDFVLENENDHFYIRFANPENPPAKPNTRATLQVFFPGSDTPATKALTISTTNTAPKLKLNPTSSILNTKLIDGLTVEAEVLGTEDESLKARSVTKGVTASIKSGKLVVTLDTEKTTTATIYLKGNDWAKEVKLTHRITVTEKKPTVKFTAKGKLDVLNPASEIVYTPKLTNAAGTITDVRLTGEDAKLFNAEVVDGLVHLKLAKSGEEYSTKKTYKVTPKVTLYDTPIDCSPVSLKVTQSALKLAKIPNQAVYQTQTAPLAVKLAVTSPANAKIRDVQLNAKTTAALRKALDAADGIQAGGGAVTFPASTFATLKPGRYTVILDVFPANAAGDTKPIQAKFTLTVQK